MAVGLKILSGSFHFWCIPLFRTNGIHQKVGGCSPTGVVYGSWLPTCFVRTSLGPLVPPGGQKLPAAGGLGLPKSGWTHPP